MTSKIQYLKRYEDTGSKKQHKKRKQKKNLLLVDDDIRWKSTKLECDGDDDSDDAPVIAAVHDDSVIKWQPVLGTSYSDSSPPKRKDIDIHEKAKLDTGPEDLSPPRRMVENEFKQKSTGPVTQKDNSPLEQAVHHKISYIHDLSPPRRYNSSKADGKSARQKQNLLGKRQDQLDNNSNHRKLVDSGSSEIDKKNEDDIQFMEWGRGVVQTKTVIDKIQEETYEMSKPLARYVDDEDLETMLKERTREGDPALLFMKKTKPSSNKRVRQGKPKYNGDYAPNRFGICPGYRWDGVDRSNGYEKAWLTKIANTKARAEESYKWSVEDM